jgi:hypothetical protein
MAITAKMAATMTRYGVKVGQEAKVATHVITGRRFQLEPEEYAIYVTAVKANYLREMVAINDVATFHQYKNHFERIAVLSGFKLPILERRQSASADYAYCCNLAVERHCREIVKGKPAASRKNLYFTLMD